MSKLLAQPAAALFLFALAAYAYFYQAGGWNQNTRFDLTRAIVEDGTLRIDRFAHNTGDLARRDGHAYCDKAPGVSLLAVPVWGVVHAVTADVTPAVLAWGVWASTVVVIGIPSALAVVALMLVALRLG